MTPIHHRHRHHWGPQPQPATREKSLPVPKGTMPHLGSFKGSAWLEKGHGMNKNHLKKMGISRYNYCKTHRIYICMVYLPIFTSKSSRNVGKYNSWILWGIHDCLNDFRFGFLIELYLVQYCTTLEP